MTVSPYREGQKNKERKVMRMQSFNVHKKAPHHSALYQKTTQTFMGKEGSTSCRLTTD